MVPPHKVKIFLVDPQPLLRAGVKAALSHEPGIEFLGEARDAASALAAFSMRSPEVVITESILPDCSASQLMARARDLLPSCRFIVLTGSDGSTHAMHLLRAGAVGFLLKSSPASELLSALRSVLNGGIFVDSSITRDLVEQSRRSRNGSTLTDRPEPSKRELEILRLTALGYGNKEMAGMLRLSIKTIETHKCRGMKKLGFRGRSDVVSYAVQCGWLPRGDSL
jgi:DNA-binding NarL/FixJ family response regulator